MDERREFEEVMEKLKELVREASYDQAFSEEHIPDLEEALAALAELDDPGERNREQFEVRVKHRFLKDLEARAKDRQALFGALQMILGLHSRIAALEERGSDLARRVAELESEP